MRVFFSPGQPAVELLADNGQALRSFRGPNVYGRVGRGRQV